MELVSLRNEIRERTQKKRMNTLANHEIMPRTSYLLSKRNKEKCLHDYMIVSEIT